MFIALISFIVWFVASVEPSDICAPVNRALQVNRACRCFASNGGGERFWIGCTREKMPLINEALNALENETVVEKLWLWDNIIPVLPASLFARVRPERLVLESSYLGHFAGRGRSPNAVGPLDALGEGLRVLELKNNILKELRAEMFRNLSALARLDLSGNRITELDARSFGAMPTLKSLSLHRNDLLRISDGTFRGLSSLKALNLAGNHLPAITTRMFEGLSELEHLDLENNAIARIEPDAFRHLPKLKSLNLGGNFLTGIKLSNLPDLERLFINNNTLSSVRSIELDAVPKLHTLNLDANQLVELPPRAFLHLSDSLEILSLANNRLSEIRADAFQNLAQLRTLSLQNNEIHALPAGIFGPLFRLRDLFLSRNRLHVLEEHTLDGLASLQVLSLAQNELKSVQSKAFAKVAFLDRLYLNGNHLQAMAAETLAGLQNSISVVDISDNPWDCDCRLLWLLSWLTDRPEKLYHEDRILCVQGSFNETLTKLAVDCVALEQQRQQASADASANSAWITAIGIVLAIVSLLIVVCIAIMYLRDHRSLQLAVVKRDLRRTPSDMVDLLGSK